MFLIDIRFNKCVIKLFDQEICNKAVDNYSHALEFVPECLMSLEMCDKTVTRYFFVFDSIPH